MFAKVLLLIIAIAITGRTAAYAQRIPSETKTLEDSTRIPAQYLPVTREVPSIEHVLSTSYSAASQSDYRWEGLTIGAVGGALLAGAIGYGFCRDSSGSCGGTVVGSAAMGAVMAGVVGGLIGRMIPKN